MHFASHKCDQFLEEEKKNKEKKIWPYSSQLSSHKAAPLQLILQH